MFKHKKVSIEESAREVDFQIVLDVVKKFDKTEFKRFMSGIESAWEGYDKILRAKTREEKEVAEIDKTEKEFLEVDNG